MCNFDKIKNHFYLVFVCMLKLLENHIRQRNDKIQIKLIKLINYLH